MDITVNDTERIVALTMNQLQDTYDVDLTNYGSPTIREIAVAVHNELNTKFKPPVRAKVIARGTDIVIIEYQERGENVTKGQREQIPLSFCYTGVKDNDMCWAQYRSNPSWGRWYLLEKVSGVDAAL